ncbi:MAG: hypothetical protein J0M22_05405 [Gammaproteobacteria bacterium]|jgi:hypothetical protein|nr:hypothetical protein [Gammaproteobacteria bacterium]
MLRRKRPKMLKKRRLMDVGASRRRVKRNVAVVKLHRRQRNYTALLQAPLEATSV